MHQDPKYAMNVVNRHTGRTIPHHVPLMLFSARDLIAVTAIETYVANLKRAGVDPLQIASAEERLQTFIDFANDHPDEMRMPKVRREQPAGEAPDFPIAVDGHYTYWLSGGNVVQFVKPMPDGSLSAGTTNEEVLEMLLHRLAAQNDLGPHALNDEMLVHLQGALDCQRARMRAMQTPPGQERFGVFMHKCESTNLAEFGYDVGRHVLALSFKVKGSDDLKTYHYADVPESVYDGLIEADSKGSYVSQHVVGKFEGKRMEPAPATV